MRLGLTFLLWLALATNAVAALVQQPYKIALGDRILTSVYINGQGPFQMVVDTGSSRTALLAHTIERLGLKPSGGAQITVHSFAATVSSPPYVLNELRLSEERISGIVIAELEDPGAGFAVPDGILGIDVLEKYVVVFNRDTTQIELYPPTKGLPQNYKHWRSTRMIPRSIGEGSIDFWFVDATFGPYEVDTMLDLGSGVTIITWELARKLVSPLSFPSRNDERVRDALGKGVPAFRVDRVKINLAGVRWINQVVLAANPPVFKVLNIARRPAAVVGSGLLKDNSFALDFENHRLYIGPSG